MALCDRLEASLTATAATRRRLLDALLAEAWRQPTIASWRRRNERSVSRIAENRTSRLLCCQRLNAGSTLGLGMTILWAAITVGRPDVIHVFQHATASLYEAIFRWSMVRMSLQQRGRRGQKLVRTDLFKRMDPTEKGAVNYFSVCLSANYFRGSSWMRPGP